MTPYVIENFISVFYATVILGHETRESTSHTAIVNSFNSKKSNLEIFAMAPAVSDFSNKSLFFETIRMKTSFYAAPCKIVK